MGIIYPLGQAQENARQDKTLCPSQAKSKRVQLLKAQHWEKLNNIFIDI
jgi:hypothetical protein